jgi:hypothetical protein
MAIRANGGSQKSRSRCSSTAIGKRSITKLKLVKRQMYGRGKKPIYWKPDLSALHKIDAAPKVRQSQFCAPIDIPTAFALSSSR